MIIFIKKKKVISLLFLAIILIGSFLAWSDLNSENSTIKKISHSLRSVIQKKAEVFAQQLPLYFMPLFPQRLAYLASELAVVSQELEYSNQELNNLTQNCDCRYAESQCQQNKIVCDYRLRCVAMEFTCRRAE